MIFDESSVIRSAGDAAILTELAKVHEGWNSYALKYDIDKYKEGEYDDRNVKEYLEGKFVNIKIDSLTNLGVITDFKQLGINTKFGKGYKNINDEDLFENLKELNDIFVIDFDSNNTYYIKDNRIWGINGETSISEIVEQDTKNIKVQRYTYKSSKLEDINIEAVGGDTVNLGGDSSTISAQIGNISVTATPRGWSTSNKPDASIEVPIGENVEVRKSTTYYMSYKYTVSVSYNLDGGTGSTPTTVTSEAYLNYKGETKGIDVSIPNYTTSTYTKSNYIFIGWSDTKGETKAKYTKNNKYTFDKDTTLYAVWSKSVSKDEIIDNPSEYIEKKLVDENNVVTTWNNVNWLVLSVDSNNIYLIAEDYVPINLLPSKGSYSIRQRDNNYCGDFYNIINAYNGISDIQDSRLKNLNSSYFNSGYSSSYIGSKAVAYLNDISIWNKYLGSKAEYVIGGPTIEQLITSYNQQFNTNYKANAVSNRGYQISKDNGGSWADAYSGMFTTNSKIFVCSDKTHCNEYWVASPTNYYGDSQEGDNLMAIYGDGWVSYDDYQDNNAGFRPMVCLSSDVRIIKQSDGTYVIE